MKGHIKKKTYNPYIHRASSHTMHKEPILTPSHPTHPTSSHIPPSLTSAKATFGVAPSPQVAVQALDVVTGQVGATVLVELLCAHPAAAATGVCHPAHANRAGRRRGKAGTLSRASALHLRVGPRHKLRRANIIPHWLGVTDSFTDIIPAGHLKALNSMTSK